MIPRDVLLDGPNYPGGSRLRRAAAQELHAAKPNPENPVKLPAFARCCPLEDDLGEVLMWAIGGRGVIGKNWGF